MGAFIGPLGGLIELMHHQEAQSVSQGADPEIFEGLDGAKTAFVQPPAGRALRVWDVSQSVAWPEQAAAFHALCLGAQGIGPFSFVDPLAQWNNVMGPRESLLEPSTLWAGVLPSRVVVPGLGSMPAGVVVAGVVGKFGSRVPVIPGRVATVSVWVVSPGSVTVTAQCRSAVGGGTHGVSRVVSDAAAGQWVTATVKPSSISHQVEIQVKSTAAVTVACPSVVWLDRAVPWSVGRGAKAVVVSGFSESYERTGRLDGQRVIGYSAKVTEVGSGA